MKFTSYKQQQQQKRIKQINQNNEKKKKIWGDNKAPNMALQKARNNKKKYISVPSVLSKHTLFFFFLF